MPPSDSYKDCSGDYSHCKIRLASNIKNDPDGILSTLPLLVCLFCEFATPIVFDMDLHLYEEHRSQLRKRFPGSKIDDILEYVLMQLTTAAKVQVKGQ